MSSAKFINYTQKSISPSSIPSRVVEIIKKDGGEFVPPLTWIKWGFYSLYPFVEIFFNENLIRTHEGEFPLDEADKKWLMKLWVEIQIPIRGD